MSDHKTNWNKHKSRISRMETGRYKTSQQFIRRIVLFVKKSINQNILETVSSDQRGCFPYWCRLHWYIPCKGESVIMMQETREQRKRTSVTEYQNTKEVEKLPTLVYLYELTSCNNWAMRSVICSNHTKEYAPCIFCD